MSKQPHTLSLSLKHTHTHTHSPGPCGPCRARRDPRVHFDVKSCPVRVPFQTAAPLGPVMNIQEFARFTGLSSHSSVPQKHSMETLCTGVIPSFFLFLLHSLSFPSLFSPSGFVSLSPIRKHIESSDQRVHLLRFMDLHTHTQLSLPLNTDAHTYTQASNHTHTHTHTHSLLHTNFFSHHVIMSVTKIIKQDLFQ